MRAATISANSKSGSVGISRGGGTRGARLMGLAIASFVPAVFWSALIEAAAYLLGTPLAAVTVAWTCAAITLLLAVVCAPLIMRGPV